MVFSPAMPMITVSVVAVAPVAFTVTVWVPAASPVMTAALMRYTPVGATLDRRHAVHAHAERSHRLGAPVEPYHLG